MNFFTVTVAHFPNIGCVTFSNTKTCSEVTLHMLRHHLLLLKLPIHTG
jgi:hypothetical protein